MTTGQFSVVGTANFQASSLPKISEEISLWLEQERKLSPETLASLPVASGTTYFPELKAKSNGVFFKYANGWKARAVPEKAFVAAKGWKPSFWNLEQVLDALNQGSFGYDIYITEGEIDAASLVEAGISFCQVLSVPNGASGSQDQDRGLPYISEALQAGLNKAKKIIWCGDSDEVGLALRAQMAQQFGIAKFWYVDWPEGIKDANDLLKVSGPDALRNHIFTAKPWPTTGLYKLSELPEPPKLTLWEPEIECLKGKVWLAPQTVSLVTGHPGHGKSTFFGQLWFELIRKYDLVGCFASFETRPKPHMRRQIRTLFNNGPEYQLSQDEINRADEFIDDHYLFVNHPEQRPTLSWFLDMAEIAVVRHGARLLQIDPWNRLEASRTREETETEYIGRCLRALAVFATDMNVHVQIICHPAKMESQRRGRAPELEDCSGSKNWDNMVDQGFVIHRPRLFDEVGNRVTKAMLFVRKSRFEDLGYPLAVNIDYSLQDRRYIPDYSSDMVQEK